MAVDANPGATGSPRAPRRQSFRPSYQRGPKQWDPAKVGTARGYPKTPEGYERRRQAASERAQRLNAEGRLTRRGVPDGWSGRKDELATLRAQAAQEAQQMVAALGAANALDLDDVRAEIAIMYVLSVVRDATEPAAVRTFAARIALGFLKTRLGTRLEVSARSAEDILGALVRAAV